MTTDKRWYIRVDDSKADNGLAQVTPVAAEVGRVEGSLRGKGREPQDCAKQIDTKHGPWRSKAASARKARRHEKIEPSRDGDEALRKEERRVSMVS